MVQSSTERNGRAVETLEFQLAQDLALLRATEAQFVPAEFTMELAALKEKLLLMASQAEAAVNAAVKSLIRRDDDLARRTREDDDSIDRLEVEIDELGLALLGKKPSPLDLRFVTVAMKISNNLERVGDEATTISRRVLDLSHEPQLQQAAEIPRMAALALRMLKDALDAFVSRDPAKARLVIPRDQAVDELNSGLQRALAALMAQRPSAISRCLNLMVISKSLERIADHATNVAEQVVYLYEGRDIRHLGPADRTGDVPDDPTVTPV
jgi:phosphate transport system protein